MKHENTRALFRYWNDLRNGRPAPYRSELDPRSISDLLESTFILETTGQGAPRFRLAGTKLCDQFGLELRGMSALALWQGTCRNRIKDLINEVVETPCIGHVVCRVETRSGASFAAEFVFLPLRSDLGAMSRVLGCGYYMGDVDTRGGTEPLHHVIEEVNVYGIDQDETIPDAPNYERAAPAATVKNDWRDGSVASLAARARRARGGRAPLLRAIDGGRAQNDDADDAVSRDSDAIDHKHAVRAQLRIVGGVGDVPRRPSDRGGEGAA